MERKITLRGKVLQTALAMLGLSLLVAVLATALMLEVFFTTVPGADPAALLRVFTGAQLPAVDRMIPFLIAEGVLLCVGITAVCISASAWLTSDMVRTLESLRRAADNLQAGQLDFDILTCREKELDDLCRSLEQVRQRLKRSAAESEAAGRERAMLMANLSHDLRSPVTAIKGYAEGLRDGIAATPEKQRHYLDIIFSKTRILETLVRNMTDYSEYELGRMQYHFAYMDITAFLQDAAEDYREDTARSGLRFSAQLPEQPLTVTGDGGKLRRVLDNLISNAVKYSRPEGSVRLAAEVYRGGVLVQVTDDGQGIGQDALRHVFDSFFREDTARSAAVQGSGLGLAICRSIVESHHGKIWLTSEKGKGTQAAFYLPLQREGGTA